MLKSAFVLASVGYALASMTAIPTNGSSYIMQDARTTRCVTLGAPPVFSNYRKIGMEVCTGSTSQQWAAISTNADGLQFAFSSVGVPSIYISDINAEISNTGLELQAGLYQQSIGHPEPFWFSLQPAPLANTSILFSVVPNSIPEASGVLTANTPNPLAGSSLPSPLMFEALAMDTVTLALIEPSQFWAFTPVA
ncbi:hypothetical protein MSAN_02100300 [Mycena sanguinolenta]|uniref:Ricin B lectin domain-containing protein n=1 Tax=Mycena sanguinolenta TaxID=230812 RepID=A0A8H7CKB5_9AGAR|nr:hypothetical protein MSAN_02100300 [Mycena sanguinolenta]